MSTEVELAVLVPPDTILEWIKGNIHNFSSCQDILLSALTYFHDVMFLSWDLAFRLNHWDYIWEHQIKKNYLFSAEALTESWIEIWVQRGQCLPDSMTWHLLDLEHLATLFVLEPSATPFALDPLATLVEMKECFLEVLMNSLDYSNLMSRLEMKKKYSDDPNTETIQISDT